MKHGIMLPLFWVLTAGVMLAATGKDWLADVPARDQQKPNRFHDQPAAIEAGRLLFSDHCVQCHGANAQGAGKRPSLRTPHIQSEATEGAIHWFLVNGNMRRGMPSWSKLPDQQLWQLVTYLRSLKATN
jgi:mono/diheme cytochrome c family protein